MRGVAAQPCTKTLIPATQKTTSTINHELSSYHQPQALFSSSTTSFLPTINHELSSYYQPQALFLPSTTSFLPTINHQLSSHHQPQALFLTSTSSSLPTINHNLSSHHQPPALFLLSTTSSLPNINHQLSSYHQPPALFPTSPQALFLRSTTSPLPIKHELSSYRLSFTPATSMCNTAVNLVCYCNILATRCKAKVTVVKTLLEHQKCGTVYNLHSCPSISNNRITLS